MLRKALEASEVSFAGAQKLPYVDCTETTEQNVGLPIPQMAFQQDSCTL